MTKIDIIVVVWGAAHTRIFIEIGLPSLLANGNLPGMAERADIRLLLYTKGSDLILMERTAPYQRLRDVVPIETRLIDETFSMAAHLMMSQCHRAGLAESYHRGAYAAFIPPECIWSNGSLSRLAEIAASGTNIVHMSGLRLCKETAAPAFAAWRNENNAVLSIAPRELVREGLAHLHPITLDLFYREYGQNLMPANLLWTAGQEGILAHCFHLHPLLVAANAHNAEFKTTIDDDLALVSDPTGVRDYVVTDSDDIFAYELSPLTHRVQAAFAKGKPAEVAAWAEVGMNARHRLLVEHPIRIHGGDIRDNEWRHIEAEARSVIQQALHILDMSNWQLLRKGLMRNLNFRGFARSIRLNAQPQGASNFKNAKDAIAKARRKHLRAAALQRQRGGYRMKMGACLSYLQYRRVRDTAWLKSTAYGFFLQPHRVISLIFGSGDDIRQWHWRWPYEASVLRPLKRDLARFSEPALMLTDSDKGDISFSSIECAKGVHVAPISHIPIVLAGHPYAHLIISHRRVLTANQKTLSAIRKLLKTREYVRLTTLDSGLTAEWLQTALEMPLIAQKERSYGRFGTKLMIDGVRRIRRYRPVQSMLEMVAGDNILRRLIFLPITFAGAAFLFPVTSLLTSFADMVVPRPRASAITYKLTCLSPFPR